MLCYETLCDATKLSYTPRFSLPSLIPRYNPSVAEDARPDTSPRVTTIHPILACKSSSVLPLHRRWNKPSRVGFQR